MRRLLGICEPTCQSTNRFYLTESSKSISVLFCPLMQSAYARLLHMMMEHFGVWGISLGFGNWAFSFFLDPVNIWSKAVGLPVTQGIKIIIWMLHSNSFIFKCLKEWSYYIAMIIQHQTGNIWYSRRIWWFPAEFFML